MRLFGLQTDEQTDRRNTNCTLSHHGGDMKIKVRCTSVYHYGFRIISKPQTCILKDNPLKKQSKQVLCKNMYSGKKCKNRDFFQRYWPPFPVAQANIIQATAIPHPVLEREINTVDSKTENTWFSPSGNGPYTQRKLITMQMNQNRRLSNWKYTFHIRKNVIANSWHCELDLRLSYRAGFYITKNPWQVNGILQNL